MPKPISDAIAAEPDPQKKEQIRVDSILAHYQTLVGQSIKYEDYNLRLDSLSDVRDVHGWPTITFSVTITNKQGVNVTPPDLNPISIRKPPMQVPDPRGDIDHGNGRKTREDPRTAYIQVLTELFHSLNLP